MNIFYYFSFSGIIIAITAAILGLFVYYRNPKNIVNKTYALFNLSVFFWAVGYIFWPISPDKATTLYWFRVLHMGAIFIPITFFHFTVSFLNVNRKFLVRLGYILGLFFLCFSFSPLYIMDMRPVSIFKYWGVPGPFYHLYLVMYHLYAFYACYLLYKEFITTTDPTRKKQVFYMCIGMILGYCAGSSNYILFYKVPIPPFANILGIAYSTMAAYAIVAYKLMDIEVLIKKTLVFATLFVVAFGVFVGITMFTQELIAGGKLLGLAISSVIIILAVRPFEDFLIRVTDKYLFQKKYDYKHLIREFMDELKIMVMNTTDIAQSTVDFLNASIRPTASAIFMYNRFTSQYDLVAHGDFKDKGSKIAGNSELVKILGNNGKILSVKSDSKLIPSQERDRFAASGIDVIIPLLIHKELLGILCLGKKKSDEDYSDDDIEALSDLSGALSISLNNAQLFDERADAEKRALVGTIATGINHEVGNPLNIITIKLDTFRILAKEGMLANKTKEQIIEDVNEIAKVCLVSAQRIAEITKQVSEFAKPDKKLIFDKVNINEAIDETITFLKNGMILDTNIVEKRITCDPVYAMADRGQLKQMLFNLIKNASHAIDKDNGKIAISVEKNNTDEIVIKIVDNGHGMPKEVMDRVFTPFFTTKEPGRGTGLGLALVKIMVDRNGGKIKVESNEGAGTTFTLIFKGGYL